MEVAGYAEGKSVLLLMEEEAYVQQNQSSAAFSLVRGGVGFSEKPRGPRKSGFLDDNLEVVGGGLAVKNRVASLVGFLGDEAEADGVSVAEKKRVASGEGFSGDKADTVGVFVAEKKRAGGAAGVSGDKVDGIIFAEKMGDAGEGEHLLPTDPILRDKQFPEIFVFKYVHPMVGSSGINFLGDKSESVGPCKPGPLSDMGLINVPIAQGVVSPMIEFYYQPVAIMKKEELAMVGSAVKKNPKWKRKERSGVNISVDNSVNISGKEWVM
jgi:hypothetical protein